MIRFFRHILAIIIIVNNGPLAYQFSIICVWTMRLLFRFIFKVTNQIRTIRYLLTPQPSVFPFHQIRRLKSSEHFPFSAIFVLFQWNEYKAGIKRPKTSITFPLVMVFWRIWWTSHNSSSSWASVTVRSSSFCSILFSKFFNASHPFKFASFSQVFGQRTRYKI